MAVGNAHQSVRNHPRLKNAQQSADAIVAELRRENLPFDDDLLAESVTTVLLQQSMDLSGFVEARVESHQNGIFEVIGCAFRDSGEEIEFMSRICLWWSGGGHVQCTSLGLVWR